MMFLHITGFTIFSKRDYGSRKSKESLGGSVAKASAAKVSMIKLTQSIWTAVSGGSVKMSEPEKTMKSATRLTVIWNYKNLRTPS